MTSYTAADVLKYAAARLWQVTEWTTDSIGGACCEGVDHDAELDAISDAAFEIVKLAGQFGDDPHRYSDGRQVKSTREIEPGVYTVHVWHPNPDEDKIRTWRGYLRSDPDVPSPGVYEVTCDPATQDIHVRVVRLV